MKNLKALSGMPQMNAAFAGWEKQITLTLVKQTVTNDGIVQNATSSFTFNGTIQPLSPKQIALKPEGQRAWAWLQIHCKLTTLAPPPVIPASLWDTPGAQWDTPGQNFDQPLIPTFDQSGLLWDTPGLTYDAASAPQVPPPWYGLNVNDQIIFNSNVYKIMGQYDYSLNGFIEYHAVKDYQ